MEDKKSFLNFRDKGGLLRSNRKRYNFYSRNDLLICLLLSILASLNMVPTSNLRLLLQSVTQRLFPGAEEGVKLFYTLAIREG